MSGTWQSTKGTGFSEEHWTDPVGDNMTGTYRELENGKAVFFEILIIMEQTASGPVLKLKHFNAGLIGWENKDEVVQFELVDLSSNRARFQNPKTQTRISYEQADPDHLLAVLEYVKDGKVKREEFHLTRKK